MVPMKPQWFQILLALTGSPLHGYGIQREVLRRTDGAMTLWPAMLYRSLAALEADGLIEKASQPGDEPDDERRQYYALTRSGHATLAREGELLARWASAAREAGAGG